MVSDFLELLLLGYGKEDHEPDMEWLGDVPAHPRGEGHALGGGKAPVSL